MQTEKSLSERADELEARMLRELENVIPVKSGALHVGRTRPAPRDRS